MYIFVYYVCMRVCMYIRMCIYVCMYDCIYVCIYACICVLLNVESYKYWNICRYVSKILANFYLNKSSKVNFTNYITSQRRKKPTGEAQRRDRHICRINDGLHTDPSRASPRSLVLPRNSNHIDN